MQSSSINEMNCKAEAGRRKHFFFRYFLLYAALVFCMYQYNIGRIYGFSLYPDEFGYWASAAKWIGYDWSGAAALGSYYSFGYGLILAPILWFCQNSVTAYRAAVTVNMLLQCASIGLLWGIFRRLYFTSGENAENVHVKEMHILFAVGGAAFYPVWTFYTQMTMAEALLVFVYVLICYEFVLLFEKPKMIRVMLLSLSFLYLYFIHMRTVGVVLAAAVVMVLYLWHMPEYRKLLVIGAAVLIAGAGVGLYVKGQITGTVYATTDAARLAVNDYAGQLGKIKAIFTGKGLAVFLSSCAGKVYYLGMASFGLFYPAVRFCMEKSAKLLKSIFSKRRNGEEKSEKEVVSKLYWIYPFLLCSMAGQLLVSAVFMYSSGRADGIIYGRYNDYILPVYIGIGILALFESRHPVKEFLVSAGISMGLFGIVLWRSLPLKETVMYGFHAAALNYLPDSTEPYQILPEFCKAYCFGIVLMALLTGCIGLYRHMKESFFLIGIVLLIEIFLTNCLHRKYTLYFNDIDYQDLRIYEYIEENSPYAGSEVHGGNIKSKSNEAYADMPVYYLYGGGDEYIDLIQFAMRDKTINIMREQEVSGEKIPWKELEGMLPEEGFLIADIGSEYLDELEECYRKCRESASFVLFAIE